MHPDTYKIAKQVAEKHGTTVAVLLGRTSIQRLFDARVEFVRRIRAERGLSSGVIARITGRDHTTITRMFTDERLERTRAKLRRPKNVPPLA